MSERITIVTGATAEYRPMVDLLTTRASWMFGYPTRVYNLGRLGTGIPWPDAELDGWRFKPRMILDALNECEGPVVYLDADAVLLSSLSDVFEHETFDIGVTIRDKKELDGKSEDGRAFLGWVNAGVLFFRPTDEAKRFVAQWAEVIECEGVSDQEALNRILFPTGKWPGHYRILEDPRPTRVYTLPGETFNYRGEVYRRPDDTRVLHLHSGRWRRFLSDLAEFGPHVMPGKEVAA